MNDYYFIVSGWGIPPNNNIQSKAYIQDVRGIDPCTFLQKKYLVNTKTSTPHTQNHDLETEYDTQLPSRKLDDISLKIDGWKTTFQLGLIRLWFFSFWQTV